MTMTLLLLLVGCNNLDDTAAFTETSEVDRLTRQVARLDPVQREAAASELRELTVADPYTRAAMQLPIALHAAALEVDPSDLSPAIHEEWAVLVSGLAAHVALLDALDISLPEPTGDDVLAAGPPGLFPSREVLENSGDPLALTTSLVLAIPELVAETDEVTRAEIDGRSAVVEAVTGIDRPCPRGPLALAPGHPWTLGRLLGQSHDRLRALEPHGDPTGRIAAMADALDAWRAANETWAYAYHARL